MLPQFVAAGAELDQRRAEAADWFAASDNEGLLNLYMKCAADDPGTMRTLTDEELDCVQRLACIALLQACVDAEVKKAG